MPLADPPPDQSELTSTAFGPPPGGGLGDLAAYIAQTPQRGLNMAADYFTGRTLTDLAKQGIHMAYGLSPQGLGDHLISSVMPSDAHTEAVAAAMRDEAEGIAAKIGTDPVALLTPASRAAALLFLPGAVRGAAQGFEEAGQHYYAGGEKITPEVGRALVRGVANTVAAAGAGVASAPESTGVGSPPPAHGPADYAAWLDEAKGDLAKTPGTALAPVAQTPDALVVRYTAPSGVQWAAQMGKGGEMHGAAEVSAPHPTAQAVLNPQVPPGVSIDRIVKAPGADVSPLKDYLFGLNPSVEAQTPGFEKAIANWASVQQ